MGLLDSGAVENCIRESVVQRYGFPRTNTQEANLYGASGEAIPVLGTSRLQVEVEGFRMSGEFKIIRNLSHQIIFGQSFLSEHGFDMNFGSKVVTFGNELVAALKQEKPVIFVLTSEPVLIPPQSEVFINATVDRPYRRQTSTVEPVHNLGAKKLALAHSVVNVNAKNGVPVKLLNPTGESIYLGRKTKIGIISPLKEGLITNNQTSTDLNAAHPETKMKPAGNEILSDKKIVDTLGVTISEDDTTADERLKLINLIAKNADVFARSLDQITQTDLVTHKIDTGDHPPTRCPRWRRNEGERAEIARQLDQMLEAGIIKESNSPWSSPVILVPKKGGEGKQEWRFVLDLRKVNAVTKKEHQWICSIEDVIDTMAAKRPRFFAALDMRCRYHAVRLDKDTANRTAFDTDRGKMEYTVLNFGLCNAPITFRNLMNTVLRGLLFERAIVYLDDILSFGATVDDLIDNLQDIFDRFRKANLKLNPAKCMIAFKKIEYLGHLLSEEGVAPCPEQLEGVKSFPVPTTQKKLRSFIGLASFFRKFVPRFSEVMGDLYKLLRQGVKFEWRKEHQTAFDRIKNALLTAPVLKYADFKEPFILLTDASKTAISYTLLQKDKEGNIHPVNYGGRALLRAVVNYGISDLELLALVQGVKTNHVFLANSKFTCYTDHLSCTFLDRKKGSAGRLGRWSLYLQAYDFEVKYKSSDSKIIQVADALSRRVYPEYVGKDMDEQIDEFIITVGNAAEEYTHEQRERRQWKIWELEGEEDRRRTIGMVRQEAGRVDEGTGEKDVEDQANERGAEREMEGEDIAEETQTTIDFEGEQM